MSILERERMNRPENEDMLRGIEKWRYPADYMGTDYKGYYILFHFWVFYPNGFWIYGSHILPCYALSSV